MTDIAVTFDPATGAATIALTGTTIAEPRFRLRDTRTERYLTKRGWGKTAAYLPGEAVVDGDSARLVLDADLARRIPVGSSLSVEQPASNIFASLVWPVATAAGALMPDVAAPAAIDIDSTDTSTNDMPAVEDDPVDDAPVSLEPTIRDEVVTPFRLKDEPAAASRLGDSEDDEEEEEGRPWGLIAAVAIVGLVLGSIFSYVWHNSSYDSDLQTAMKALEAQRDQDKASFEKQLADAQSKAGTTSSSAINQAAAKLGSLQDQATELTKERNEARASLAEQEATVTSLQEKLTTANGEIETLKNAAEADASEKTAIFNDRIETLNKDLAKARGDLDAAHKEISRNEQAFANSDAELKKAVAEVSTLKQAASAGAARDGKIEALTQDLKKAQADLGARDTSLRDVQAQLSVAQVEIDALKQVANKAATVDLEKTSLADRITQLTNAIDKADKDLAAKDEELAKAKTSLEAANALLAKNDEALKASKDKPVETASTGGQSKELQEERDLYASELKTLTENFAALKKERDALSERVASLDGTQSQGAGEVTASSGGSRAIWGATAIDQSGAIYSLQNQIAEKSATENAVALCRGKSNGRCQPLQTYSGSCFSLARIDGEGPRNDNFGFAVKKSWKSAEMAAVEQCEQLGDTCTVRFTACSPDALSKPAVNQ